MKHRIRIKFKYARKITQWLYTSTSMRLLFLVLILTFIGYKSEASKPEITCKDQIREVMSNKRSMWLGKCQVFIAFHGFNDQGINQFRVYRKEDWE